MPYGVEVDFFENLVLDRSSIVLRKYILEKCKLLHLCFSRHLKLHIDRRFCIVESISRHSCQKIDNKTYRLNCRLI